MMYYTNTNKHNLHTAFRRAVLMVSCLMAIMFSVPAKAQVVIGGNVYGGGNQGDLEGNANVELKGGIVKGNVFGGARMADIDGKTYVHINGADADSALIVKAVYGGNDISGRITGSGASENAHILASTNTNHPVIIGALYGGGNGDYKYVPDPDGPTFDVTLDDGTYIIENKPIIAKTRIEINGGIYGSIYGGGNAATVTEATTICLNNATAIDGTLNSIPASQGAHLALLEGTDYRLEDGKMIFPYHVNRMFGGNNLAEMNIRPTWDLQKADINNLYSGGNRGAMTSPGGICIAIQSDDIRVNNVYGGCRMANVNPGAEPIAENIYGFDFAAGYAARVYITGGKINNVYGGNDISGKVYYGTNVEIHGAISGDVYGGGNGSYAYTDQESWVDAHPDDADYYYDAGFKPGDTEALKAQKSLDSLYLYRPHVEKTLVQVAGTESKRVVVAGGLYCGGNSATLDKDGDQSGATATFRIGKYTDIQEVFLGSNGENMISDDILAKYANNAFSAINLKDPDQMARYMAGVAVNIKPNIDWIDNNLDYQTRIGSLFCGGNVGSMTYDGIAGSEINGETQMEFPEQLVIFDKIVAGCNSANVAAKDGYNAAYMGGLVGENVEGTKVRMLVRSRLEPGKLTITRNGLYIEKTTYELNTIEAKIEDANGDAMNTSVYVGANVYGGCFNSGYVNGGVEINVENDLVSPKTYENAARKATLTNTGDYVYASAMAIYGGGYGANAEIRGNTQINFNKNARVLLAFGGGEMGSVSGNAEVTFGKDLVLPGAEKDNLNVYKAYAGGFAGRVAGNTELNLLGGGVMRAFAGACNANIGGYAMATIGAIGNEPGLPYVATEVIGGNDFGGQIEGSNTWERTVDGDDKTITSNTYVQYLSGNIGEAIYGGSYGSYNYKNKDCYPDNVPGQPITQPVHKPTLNSTFVDIASQSTNIKDIIGSKNSEETLTLVAGGGRGYKGLPDSVEVANTYVLLRSTDREYPIAHRVYGGGNLSKVGNTLVDAYEGNYGRIFGGTHGVLTRSVADAATSYDIVASVINVHNDLKNESMDIFGAGANSGATDTTTINLYGGTVNDVHGGAFTEGYTAVTNINVPDGSTAKVNALFGGGLGEDEWRPCDVGVSNIIYATDEDDASVDLGIYGGNHTARVTKNTNITISATVKDVHGDISPVYGAGLGELTVSGFTKIDLENGAKVSTVFGGGAKGKIYNHYSFYTGPEAGTDAVQTAVKDFYAANPGRHANWTNEKADNTIITIDPGAVVTKNVYGGGEGKLAYVSGKTHVKLLGGSVVGDIYGGGDAGAMPCMVDTTNGAIPAQLSGQVIEAYCQIDGGEVRNVFGGGFQGDTEGNTRVSIGKINGATFTNGKPTIQRSAYGGGELAKVSGTSTVNMYQGYVGYEYVDGDFVALLDLKDANDNLLKENGNLYGAGYGEGAVVMQTFVNFYDGVIRNGLYGGGEIAAVGIGATKLENEKYVLDTSEPFVAGKTHVRMYGGKVEGDVFGGGRGFSYDLTGNQVTGKIYYTDGYVFGATDVEIYRGEIGTIASVREGHGNVFGGGNIGYVYSQGEISDGSDGKEKGHYYFKDSDKRTEDCRVHITARCMVTADEGVTINDSTYQKGEYVTTEDLNTLAFGDDEWDKLDTKGLTIRNAVFAGGNVSSGSDKIYANAVTVYGNATAAVVDVYAKDFISLGGEHVGGLYGDGNLTFVDGYRELNITNYGTDYYNLSETLTYEDYQNLPEREKQYYALIYLPKVVIEFTHNNGHRDIKFYYEKHTDDYPVEVQQSAYETMLTAWNANMEAKWEKDGDNYKAKVAINEGGFSYAAGATLSEADYNTMLAAWTKSMTDKWTIKGECSITAGRMMNTVQRADFCGIFGSRILLHGAQDRVPDVVDYTNYTINRLGELSLNRVRKDQPDEHGNYFGIYNVVNLLGALTSDIKFDDPHEYLDENGDIVVSKAGEDTISYRQYKETNLGNRTKNTAVAENMVAQASGVFLEIVDSISPDKSKKFYGPITGIIQLDLINVEPGEGGGYVYAKNIHGKAELDENKLVQSILSDANAGAITRKAYSYSETEFMDYQSSGNFVNKDPKKRIVDDCFPRGGYYLPNEDGFSTAHYWYVRGDFYVYDQYLSAYTGAAQAYTQTVNIPLTITAGSDGQIELISIKDNLHADFVGLPYKNGILTAADSIEVRGVTYGMNDPISYWDWSQLPSAEQIYFTETMNYVAVNNATIGGTEYKKGDVLSPTNFEALKTAHSHGFVIEGEGTEPIEMATDTIFRITNELSHEAGYLLTFDITNPLAWDDYYTKLSKEGDKVTSILETEYLKKSESEREGYIEGPTLLCNQSGIYGQRFYELDAIVDENVFASKSNISDDIWNNPLYTPTAKQASFEPAYVATGEVTFNYDGKEYHMFESSYISKTMYDALASSGQTEAQAMFLPAYLCTNTIEVADKVYIISGELISEDRHTELSNATSVEGNTFMYQKTIGNYFSPAYVCTAEGMYGGKFFQETKNYDALSFCGLPRAERNAVNNNDKDVFMFNYDALDLLIADFDPDKRKYGDTYAERQPVDFEATYKGENTTAKRKVLDGLGNYNGVIEDFPLNNNAKLTREQYELLLNEKSHYFPIVVDNAKATMYYVVREEFQKANVYYPVGRNISQEMYETLSAEQQSKINVYDTTEDSCPIRADGTYYFCVEDFVKNTSGDSIHAGSIISEAAYTALPNYQTHFMVHGHSPVETSTLYVSRESDILNLNEDRVITVEYKYTYKEGDAEGTSYETYAEKHVVNIHIQFKSGLPTIGEVTPPATVLPNSVVGLSVPSVTKGAYEILGGGWEMYETLSDANEHKNGVAYKNNATPMYWYQNNYYVAYFAKTYLGKAYSNPVPFSVANYHRIGEVMNHDQRMFIDHKDVDRASKIYIDAAQYPYTSIAGEYHVLEKPDGRQDGKNDLDYFYDLYLETKAGKTTPQPTAKDNTPYVFNPRIKNAENLEFFLRSDIEPRKYKGNWTPIGATAETAFAGKLHGNGYTINNLDKSLFGHLADSVYNLGVMGSFTGGGVADVSSDKGYAENCWVYTTGTPTGYAIFGNNVGTIKNSYYCADNAFTEGGKAIKETRTDFEQGEVAYQLNHFYLNKRYSDNTPSITTNAYKYLLLDVANNTLSKQEGYYTDDHVIYVFADVKRSYVEDYYADGDFIYANGEIPLTVNERLDEEDKMYYPIYPDDYIFFGQRLSYKEDSHNDWPARIKKRTNDEGQERILRAGDEANRVYRAPAYYMNKVKREAYFNSNAVFVDEYNGTLVDHNMTAIDFTGYNDNTYGSGHMNGVFHLPILDFEGLSSISIDNLTPNLLVYADPADTKTYAVLDNYLEEPVLAFDEDYDFAGAYWRVPKVSETLHGHLVDKSGEGFIATRDHFLVDKENFNAPISYTFATKANGAAKDYLMWYQRTPDRFANHDKKGWDVVCLPFTAGMVTTHQKGEITHFYGDDATMHEYWLRKFVGFASTTIGGKAVDVATFVRPAAVVGNEYTRVNSFLYDYYYNRYDDANADDYMDQNQTYQEYYKGEKTYKDYAYLTAQTPYIVAFPGKTYYEFDMSGQFVAEHTASPINQLETQVVTMISDAGAVIAVSDDENRKSEVLNGYQFVGTYQKESLTTQHYLIDAAGASFDVVKQASIDNGSALSVPFRGYIVGPAAVSSAQASVKSIYIGGAGNEEEQQEEIGKDQEKNGSITIYGKKNKIYIESTLDHDTTVVIYSISGQIVKRVHVKAGGKKVVEMPSRGIYIANKQKVSVV